MKHIIGLLVVVAGVSALTVTLSVVLSQWLSMVWAIAIASPAANLIIGLFMRDES